MIKRVLVVEDEPDISKVILFRLKNAGYDVTHASHGQEAFEILKKDPNYDLIILDLIMPVMDGYQLARILHQNNMFTDIPVIVLSASAGSDLKTHLNELHACDYILKPFETETLLLKVKKQIR